MEKVSINMLMAVNIREILWLAYITVKVSRLFQMAINIKADFRIISITVQASYIMVVTKNTKKILKLTNIKAKIRLQNTFGQNSDNFLMLAITGMAVFA